MLRHMLETRAPLYGEVATLTVQTGGRLPEDVVAEILAALPGARTGR
jgi:shikimate kinase